MNITLPQPKSGYIKRMVIYDVPGGASLLVGSLEIDLKPGIQVIDFVKMLSQLKQYLQEIYPKTKRIEKRSLMGLCITSKIEISRIGYNPPALGDWVVIWGNEPNYHDMPFDFESKRFLGLDTNAGNLKLTIITPPIKYKYSMYWKGQQVSAGNSSHISFPDCYVDQLIIEDVPSAAKLLYAENPILNLTAGRAIIDFTKILHHLREKEKTRVYHLEHPGGIRMHERSTQSEIHLLYIAGHLQNIINNTNDWKHISWDGMNGENLEGSLTVMVYSITPIKCEYQML